jgi:hypothetical protein
LEKGNGPPVRITSTLDPAIEAWQVGSKAPPKVCLCCGLRFDDGDRKRRGRYENLPYIYVCERCWAQPFLFFPDKVLADCGECWLPPGTTEHVHPTTGRIATRRGKPDKKLSIQGKGGHGR